MRLVDWLVAAAIFVWNGLRSPGVVAVILILLVLAVVSQAGEIGTLTSAVAGLEERIAELEPDEMTAADYDDD